jgi:hypothetical protein
MQETIVFLILFDVAPLNKFSTFFELKLSILIIFNKAKVSKLHQKRFLNLDNLVYKSIILRVSCIITNKLVLVKILIKSAKPYHFFSIHNVNSEVHFYQLSLIILNIFS